MTIEREITCIVCPIGCKIFVKINNKRVEMLEGHKCKQGIEYAKREALDPRRMLTSSVFVVNGQWPLVSVKSTQPIPKNKIFSVLKEIRKTKINAPIKSGQKIIENVADTKIDIVATKSIQKKR